MSVQKRCRETNGCKHASPRCDHPWYLRIRSPFGQIWVNVTDYAISRGSKVAISAKSEAERVWVPRIQADIAAGLDPRKLLPHVEQKIVAGSKIRDVIVNHYIPEYVEVEDLKRREAARAESLIIADVIGDLPLSALETTQPADLVKARWAKNKLSTRNRKLSRLRSLTYFVTARPEVYGISKNPFQLGRVEISTTKEAKRHRRIDTAEEAKLFAAARTDLMRARLLAAFELGLRADEMCLIQAKSIDFDNCIITLTAQTTKDSELRMLPFDPGGTLEAHLKARSFDEDGNRRPEAFVFGNEDGTYLSHHSMRKQWYSVVLRAHGHNPTYEHRGGYYDAATRQKLDEVDLHWHDIRHEAASRWYEKGLTLIEIRDLLGHADVKTTQRYLHVTMEQMKTGSLHKKIYGRRPTGGLKLVKEAVQ